MVRAIPLILVSCHNLINEWFPPGLLEEFQKTVNVLRLCEDERMQRSVRLLQRKDSVDFETSMGRACHESRETPNPDEESTASSLCHTVT